MSITIEQYSELSLVVRGDTKAFKSHLLNLEGKFNSNLKGGAGWIFSKKKSKDVLEKLQSDISSGKIKSESDESSSSSSSSSSKPPESESSSSKPTSSNEYVSMKQYLSLLSRLERLEQICSHVSFVEESKNTKNPKVKIENIDIEFADNETKEDSQDEREDNCAVVGLLRKKKLLNKKK